MGTMSKVVVAKWLPQLYKNSHEEASTSFANLMSPNVE